MQPALYRCNLPSMVCVTCPLDRGNLPSNIVCVTCPLYNVGATCPLYSRCNLHSTVYRCKICPLYLLTTTYYDPMDLGKDVHQNSSFDPLRVFFGYITPITRVFRLHSGVRGWSVGKAGKSTAGPTLLCCGIFSRVHVTTTHSC